MIDNSSYCGVFGRFMSVSSLKLRIFSILLVAVLGDTEASFAMSAISILALDKRHFMIFKSKILTIHVGWWVYHSKLILDSCWFQ